MSFEQILDYFLIFLFIYQCIVAIWNLIINGAVRTIHWRDHQLHNNTTHNNLTKQKFSFFFFIGLIALPMDPMCFQRTRKENAKYFPSSKRAANLLSAQAALRTWDCMAHQFCALLAYIYCEINRQKDRTHITLPWDQNRELKTTP